MDAGLAFGPRALGGPAGAGGRLLPRLGAAALLASLETLRPWCFPGGPSRSLSPLLQVAVPPGRPGQPLPMPLGEGALAMAQ